MSMYQRQTKTTLVTGSYLRQSAVKLVQYLKNIGKIEGVNNNERHSKFKDFKT